MIQKDKVIDGLKFLTSLGQSPNDEKLNEAINAVIELVEQWLSKVVE